MSTYSLPIKINYNVVKRKICLRTNEGNRIRRLFLFDEFIGVVRRADVEFLFESPGKIMD